MVVGLLWLGGGTAVSLATYMSAAPGGTYLLFWAPIVWGVWTFAKGFMEWLNSK